MKIAKKINKINKNIKLDEKMKFIEEDNVRSISDSVVRVEPVNNDKNDKLQPISLTYELRDMIKNAVTDNLNNLGTKNTNIITNNAPDELFTPFGSSSTPNKLLCKLLAANKLKEPPLCS